MDFELNNTRMGICINTNELIATRFIGNRICKIIVKLDGNIGDLGAKVNRTSQLSDHLFSEFDRVRVEVEAND